METSQIAGSNSGAAGTARATPEMPRKVLLKEELGQLRKAAGELIEKRGEYVKNAEIMVRRRPLTSVAVVAGVSALAAYLATRLTLRSAK